MAVPEVLFFKVLRTHTHGSSRWCGHDFHTHGSKLQTIMFGKERGSMRHKGAVRQMSHRRVYEYSQPLLVGWFCHSSGMMFVDPYL